MQQRFRPRAITSSVHFTFRSRVALAVSSVMMLATTSLLSATSAGAVGTIANSITASNAPAGASVRGSYTPSALARSGDKVLITLNKYSKGCTLSSGKVTFAAVGTCLVDFNDAGNTTFAAAKQIEQSINVVAANVITVSKPPSAGSAGGSFSPGATATSGDAVVRTIDKYSTGCALSSGKVTFTGAGTCRVDFNDAGNGPFAAASQLQEKITVHAANVISASTAPSAGTVNGTYTPSATATSGDAVVISLDASSTGCSLAKGTVTFTVDGNCTINFSDVGNGAFAAAARVQQNIVVGVGGRLVQAPLTLTSVRSTYDHPLTLTTSGGSGSGQVTYDVTATGSAGCSIKGTTLTAARVGTCSVTATKAQDASYLVKISSATTVTLVAHVPARPRAQRVQAPAWTGRTVVTSIVGAGFYGQPRIYSNVGGTRIGVVRDTGRLLTIRVSVAKGTPRGVHVYTLVFAHGESTSVRYNQR